MFCIIIYADINLIIMLPSQILSNYALGLSNRDKLLFFHLYLFNLLKVLANNPWMTFLLYNKDSFNLPLKFGTPAITY